MINEKTVFVLGAGASYPYGLPLGKDLVEKILSQMNQNRHQYLAQLRRIGDNYSETRFTSVDIQEFLDSLSRSHLFSIDAFLQDKNEKYLEIGKLLIVQFLLPSENKDSTISREFILRKSAPNLLSRGRWYEYIFNEIFCPWDEFENNNLSVITFNYDRSFEFFLWEAIKGAYPGHTDSEYIKKMKSIEIIHMHGHLGNLQWVGPKTMTFGLAKPYLSEPFDRVIFEISKNIRLVHDEVESSSEFNLANNLIGKAKSIYFLGFGFHQMNLNRLKPGFHWSKAETIKGSAFGLEKAESDRAKAKFYKSFHRDIELGSKNLNVLEFLRSEVEWEKKPGYSLEAMTKTGS